MTDCVHGFEFQECADCLGQVGGVRASVDGAMTGQAFALVYAPTVREDTFLHLNREGDHWKLRWYASPTAPAVEVAGSAPSSPTYVADLADLELRHEIWYPTSAASDGVTVRDSRYWFDEVARANTQYADRISAIRRQG